jgi:hypothetical protein
MSFDISLGGIGGQPGAHRCDDLQLMEKYTINFQDFVTLQYKPTPNFTPSINMRAPINGAAFVRLFIKGVLVSPTDTNFGYSIVPDPNRIQEAGLPFQKIVFNNQVRTINDLIEVTYITPTPFCLKCGGTGMVVDWTVSSSGALNKVHRRAKLGQQVLKYALTSVNPFNSNLTTQIRELIGRKFGVSVTSQDIATQVSTVLNAYQSIQAAQVTVQQMDPQEMIQSIQSVTATQSQTDPTTINVNISVVAFGATEAIPLNIALQTT